MITEERRYFPMEDLRVEKVGDKTFIRGHAAVFDKLSVDLGGFRERVSPGAFKRSLRAGADVRALVDHDPSKIIGRNKANTLELKEDESGLQVKIDVANTSSGRDIVESIERRDVSGMSFAFRTINDEWHTIDGEQIRELIDVDLSDVSVVTYPAYLDTDVKVAKRSLDVWTKENKPESFGHSDSLGAELELKIMENSRK